MSEKHLPFPSIRQFPGEEVPGLPTEDSSAFATEDAMLSSELLTRSMHGTSKERSDAIYHLNALTSSPEMTELIYHQLVSRAETAQTPEREALYTSLFYKFRPVTFFPAHEDENNPESILAKKFGTTAAPGERTMHTFSIPENIKGLKILDVGAGASDFTAMALKRGADAYAIDFRYNNRHDFIDYVKRTLDSFHHDKEAYVSSKNFEQSFLKEPLRYQTAMATDLPFEDNSFDIIISQHLVLGYLDADIELLTKAVNESLRVLKKDGRLSLYPFYMEVTSNKDSKREEQRLINNNKLLIDLKKKNKSYIITPVLNEGARRLKRLDIIK